MASMAAAIAAARTASVSPNWTLDEKERNRFAYFSSLNSMAKKIMQDKERIKQRFGAEWDRMQPRERDHAIDKGLVDPHIHNRYVLHRGTRGCPEVSCCPVLRTHTGQKTVHFGEEDKTWQDEHSAPFSWETKSQMDYSAASLSNGDCAVAPKQSEQNKPFKPVSQDTQPVNISHGPQAVKLTSVGKTSIPESPPPMRNEQETASWKIRTQHSKAEDSQSNLQSLTPSQIKSLKKEGKSLPIYHVQDPIQKENDLMKIEKPHVVTKQPINTNFSMSSFNLDLKNPQPSQSSVRPLDDVLLSPPGTYVLMDTKAIQELDIDEPFLTEPPLFSQLSTSSVALKTGFDFLDNW